MFGASEDGASLKIEGLPVSSCLERSPADVSDRVNNGVGLLLLEIPKLLIKASYHSLKEREPSPAAAQSGYSRTGS